MSKQWQKSCLGSRQPLVGFIINSHMINGDIWANGLLCLPIHGRGSRPKEAAQTLLINKEACTAFKRALRSFYGS